MTRLRKIYRKPTHTNQCLKYTSHNPASARQSVIAALFDRADKVVATEKDKIEEKHHILAALQQNGYPKEFIQRKEQSKSTTEETNSLVCEIPRSFGRASPSNYRTQGSFIHVNSRKIFEHDLLSSDSVAKPATQKPSVFWDWTKGVPRRSTPANQKHQPTLHPRRQWAA